MATNQISSEFAIVRRAYIHPREDIDSREVIAHISSEIYSRGYRYHWNTYIIPDGRVRERESSFSTDITYFRHGKLQIRSPQLPLCSCVRFIASALYLARQLIHVLKLKGSMKIRHMLRHYKFTGEQFLGKIIFSGNSIAKK